MKKVKHPSASTPPIWPMPRWLPKVIRAFVESCAQAAERAKFEEIPWGNSKREVQLKGQLEAQIWHMAELRARLERLTTDQKMQSVWKYISSAPLKPDKKPKCDPLSLRDRSLLGYLQLALVLTAPATNWFGSIPPIQKQRGDLNRVHKLAHKLSQLMGSPADLHHHTLWSTFDSLYVPLTAGQLSSKNATVPHEPNDSDAIERIRSKISTLQAIFRGYSWGGNGPPSSFRILFPAFNVQLDALSTLAEAASNMTLEQPPKRQSSAFQIWYVRRLVAYVDAWLKQPLHGAIATTTNIALELRKPIKRQHVQQLLLKIKKSPVDPQEIQRNL